MSPVQPTGVKPTGLPAAAHDWVLTEQAALQRISPIEINDAEADRDASVGPCNPLGHPLFHA